jgi:hypothetical protein
MLQIKQFDFIFIVYSVNPMTMKLLRFSFILIAATALLSSCSLWNKAFPPKYGCGTDGKNVGAEKLLDGSNQKKQPKFKS